MGGRPWGVLRGQRGATRTGGGLRAVAGGGGGVQWWRLPKISIGVGTILTPLWLGTPKTATDNLSRHYRQYIRAYFCVASGSCSCAPLGPSSASPFAPSSSPPAPTYPNARSTCAPPISSRTPHDSQSHHTNPHQPPACSRISAVTAKASQVLSASAISSAFPRTTTFISCLPTRLSCLLACRTCTSAPCISYVSRIGLPPGLYIASIIMRIYRGAPSQTGQRRGSPDRARSHRLRGMVAPVAAGHAAASCARIQLVKNR